MSCYSPYENWSDEDKKKFNKIASQKERAERKFLRLCGKDKFIYWNKFWMHPNYVRVESAKDFRPDLYKLSSEIKELDDKLEGMGAISFEPM